MQDERENRPSASIFHRLALCPGSWQLSLSAPPQPTSADAQAGTSLHSHMELGTLPPNEDEAEACAWCREKEQELCSTYLGPGTPTCTRELRMWDAARRFSGKPDTIYRLADRALIIDYKFGRTPVTPAESNSQLYALAYLLMSSEPELADVYTAILQPFVTRSPQVVRFTRQDMPLLTSFVEDILAEIEAEHPRTTPGGTQCQYCPAVSHCHALSLRVQSLPAVPLESWPLFRPDQKRAAYDAAKLASKYAAEINRLVLADLMSEQEVSGLTLAPGKTTTRITDLNAAFSTLAEHGVSAADFVSACSASLPKLKTAIHHQRKAAGLSSSQADTLAWLTATLEPFLSTTTASPTIKESKESQN